MALNNTINVNNENELYSYIVNQTPELASIIDLPEQGDSNYREKIGKIIMSNQRYKNAFLNTVNVIGLTVIQRNYFEDPWNFTTRGTLRYGQQIRELAVDIAPVFDYNNFSENPTNFLTNVVPNVYNYIHEINYQKFYKTTTSDDQIAMAFNTENGIFDLIELIIDSLYQGYEYDRYLVDKYQLMKRITSGTITMIDIPDYEAKTPRERVSFIKGYSNKMTFMSPNYNPAGLRRATPFANQRLILSTDFEASLSTEVLSTSFFLNEADFKAKASLIDGFGEIDTIRLTELLGNDYEPFSQEDLDELKKVPCVIVDDLFFQDYDYDFSSGYGLNEDNVKRTDFYNPETLKNNHWVHTWKVIATSPYRQAVGFIASTTPSVNSVSLTPSEATVSAGQQVQLSAKVEVTGFANKAVVYSVSKAPGEKKSKVTVNSLTGLVTIPSDYTPTSTETANPIVIKATSVYDSSKYGEAHISVV